MPTPDSCRGTFPDEAQGWPLLSFIAALTFELSELDDLVRDTDEAPGWSAAVDLERAPVAMLPWLGQFVGVRGGPQPSPKQTSVSRFAVARVSSAAPPGAIRSAAQPFLTGDKNGHPR